MAQTLVHAPQDQPRPEGPFSWLIFILSPELVPSLRLPHLFLS